VTRPARNAAAALAVALALSVMPACNRGEASAEASGADSRPSILLIVVDALRPDHLGAYGYPRPTSPALDALAARSIRFERAYSVSSWTKPSIPSLFTSLYPAQHNVYEGNAHAKGGKLESDLLSGEARTLAEALAECGYSTGGFVHNAHLRAEFGLAQGFEVYEERSARAPELAGRLSDWMRESRNSSGVPVFAYLHLLDVHWPYEPPEEAARVLGAEGEERADDRGLRDAVNRGYLELTTEEIEGLVRRYDAEIRGADEAIGRLLHELESSGIDDLVIAVTSDHGEAFLEHGYLGHGRDLYEESVRVPLILRLPGERAAGSVVDEPVSTLDIMPTLLDVAGCPPERAGRVEGVSLAGFRAGGDPLSRSLFAEVRHGNTYRQAVWDHEDWKLVRTVRDAGPAVDASSLQGDAAFLVGLRFEVEGFRVARDRFVSEEIELEEPGDDDDEVTGVLEAIDAARRTARVAGFDVSLEDATFLDSDRRPVAPSELAAGALVKVEGATLDSGRIEADKLSLRQGRPKQQIEGIVRDARFPADDEVELLIAGLRVSVERDDLEEALGIATEPDEAGADRGAVVETFELYMLATDPGEENDLSELEPQRVRLLLDRLEATHRDLLSRSLPELPRVALDEATVDTLRGLGYVQ